MIQLHENDFLWKCYNRYYRHEPIEIIPHPHSVCNLFWKAIGGICKAIFWDSPAWIIGILSIIICITTFWFTGNIFDTSSPLLQFFLTVGCMSSGIFSAAFIIMRWGEYWHERGKHLVNMLSCILFMFVAFSFLFSLLFCKNEPWHIVYVLYSASITLAIIISLAIIVGSIFGICCLLNTSTGQIFRTYLVSFKHKVCPLVKVPVEEK